MTAPCRVARDASSANVVAAPVFRAPARGWIKVKTAAWRTANAGRGEMFEKTAPPVPRVTPDGLEVQPSPAPSRERVRIENCGHCLGHNMLKTCASIQPNAWRSMAHDKSFRSGDR